MAIAQSSMLNVVSEPIQQRRSFVASWSNEHGAFAICHLRCRWVADDFHTPLGEGKGEGLKDIILIALSDCPLRPNLLTIRSKYMSSFQFPTISSYRRRRLSQ